MVVDLDDLKSSYLHDLGNLLLGIWMNLVCKNYSAFPQSGKILTACERPISLDHFIKDSCRLVICEERLCRFNALRRRFGLCAKGVCVCVCARADILNHVYSCTLMYIIQYIYI